MAQHDPAQKQETMVVQGCIVRIRDGEFMPNEFIRAAGYKKRIGKLSRHGVPIYSAYFKAWLWEMQDGRCGYCGDAMIPGRGGQIDHIVPRSAGGSHLPPNIIYACCTCNAGKCNRPLEDLRGILRVRSSKAHGIITPRQALMLESVGIDLGLPETVEFLCEREGWQHVCLPEVCHA